VRDAKLLHPEVKSSRFIPKLRPPRWDLRQPPGLLESLANVVSLRVLQGNCSKGFRFGGALQTRERGVQDVA